MSRSRPNHGVKRTIAVVTPPAEHAARQPGAAHRPRPPQLMLALERQTIWAQLDLNLLLTIGDYVDTM